MNKPKKPLLIAIFILLILSISAVFAFTRKDDAAEVAVRPTPVPEPVNIIPVSERPYVELAPLSGRNELMITIHEPKIAAEEVEINLEYDRNEGVMDAILRTFKLDEFPLEGDLFLGSQSAGGHITYHDDVIGGKLLLEFTGENSYRLENPWRYDDSQTSYSQLSTSDGKFQVVFDAPLKTSKVVIMQSPGLPENISGEIVAGPYLFRPVGPLPEGSVTLTLRLPDESTDYLLQGWDGQSWQAIEYTQDAKTITATTEIYETYIVSKSSS